MQQKIRYFLALNYPLHIVATDDFSFHGFFPDLPGCEADGPELEALRTQLHHRRTDWLVSRIRAGEMPPFPNSHLEGAPRAVAGQLL